MHGTRDTSLFLFQGGPYFKLLRHARLIDLDHDEAWRAAALSVFITWVPLAVLTLAQGLLIGDGVQVPFLLAIKAHARLLVAIPLLILAEPIVNRRWSMAANHFVRSNMVPQDEIPRFMVAIGKAGRMRDSGLVELLLLLVSFAGTIVGPILDLPASISNWQFGTAGRLTLAGWWNVLVNLTLFHFLLLRWIWRLFIWSLFLWNVSRLKLRLYPVHADYAGGLGFLGLEQATLKTIVFAMGCVLSGSFAQRMIFYEGVQHAELFAVAVLYGYLDLLGKTHRVFDMEYITGLIAPYPAP